MRVSLKPPPSSWIINRIKAITSKKELQILDFASGSGRHSISLADHKRKITAVDNDSKKLSSYKNILNHSPQCSNLFQSNISLFKNFIHIHYKDYIFKKNGWSHSSFLKLLNKLSLKNKIVLTSDFGNFDYHKFFLSNFSYLDFDNSTDKIDLKQNIHYLHNINTSDLFKLISLSKTVVSPHGAMTVMASYLQKKVIDIFDVNININAFREFKPRNDNYNFFIIKPNFEKILFKINKFL